MHKWCGGGALGLMCLVLAGCATKPAPVAPPAQVLSLLPTGQPLLRCREACLEDWRKNAETARQLDASGRWAELASLVVRVGYQDDLTLYYLGRAAEGLGYGPGAASYYRQSMQISGTSLACRYKSRLCAGVVLPAAAETRLAAIGRERTPPRRGRARAVPHRRETSPSEPVQSEPVPAEPRQAEAPAPPPPPPPLPPPVAPGASDYIEPPPAMR